MDDQQPDEQFDDELPEPSGEAPEHSEAGGEVIATGNELTAEELWEDAVFFAVDARISGVYGMGWVGIQKRLRINYPDYSLDQVMKVIAEAKQQMELMADSGMSEQRALMLERLERIFTSSSSNRWKLKALDQMAQILGLRKGDAPKAKKKKVININVLSMTELEMLAQVQKKVISVEEVKESEPESPFAPVTIDAKYAASAGGGDDGEEWQEQFEEDQFEGVDEEDEEEDD